MLVFSTDEYVNQTTTQGTTSPEVVAQWPDRNAGDDPDRFCTILPIPYIVGSRWGLMRPVKFFGL